jgi:hypothetical protein
MNRTHWAVEDEDLLKVLATAGLVPASESNGRTDCGVSNMPI